MKKLPRSKQAIMAILAAGVFATEMPAHACDDPPSEWDCAAKDFGVPCGEVSPEYKGGITHSMILNIQGGKYVAEVASEWTKAVFVVTGSSLQDLQNNLRRSDEARNWMKIKVVEKSVDGRREKRDISIGNPLNADLSKLAK